jgi:sulfite dehydrogenase (quinone) subunit SoeA
LTTPLTPAADRPVQFEDRRQQKTHFTTCYMCACRCGIKVTTEEKPGEPGQPSTPQVRFIQGNKNHLVNQGVLCAKGSAGIMKQYSKAKLQHPMIRRPGTERGEGIFDPISWDDALDLLTKRLAHIRATDPKKLAFFTGRDQMQALTGLWAQQFGTPNWAAHGGFCSVNMAAAGLYSIGYSFWEFGAPDWDRAKYFVLWGVAEDHSSNPIKIGLDKLKTRGAKFVSVNPVRTGYSAIADEWVPIRPGTDGLFALAIVHELLNNDWIDHEYLARYTNAPWLVIDAPGTSQDGLFLRDEEGKPLVWDQNTQSAKRMEKGVAPALMWSGSIPSPAARYQPPGAGRNEVAVPTEGRDEPKGSQRARVRADAREFDDGFANSPPSPSALSRAAGEGTTRARTVFSLILNRYTKPEYAAENVSAQCGVPAEQIKRIAAEIAQIAFKETIELPCEWTDIYGNQHNKVVGRPVAFYAMRGISAHANGFQSCRSLHLIQMLLGALDGPGNFRSKAPFPRPIPPAQLPENDPGLINAPNTALSKTPLGFPTRPEELAIDANGQPLRIDKAYSWEAPLASHGMMHAVIKNAVEGDPYKIDTLILFMANMAWNSAMNTAQTQDMLRAKSTDGEYKIPFLVVADAFDSETVRFADLVLPDTTYLERYDAISFLDRPISEPDAAADAIRHPILPLDRDVRPWQDVLVDLATRLKFPAFVTSDGEKKFAGYTDFIVNYERAPGIGFLGGFRGKDGEKSLRGEANPNQWKAYIEAQSFFAHHWPENQRWMRAVNRDYLNAATDAGFIPKAEPIIAQLYSEPLQKFRLAGAGAYVGAKPTREIDRERLQKYFDPLPVWYEPTPSPASRDQPLGAGRNEVAVPTEGRDEPKGSQRVSDRACPGLDPGAGEGGKLESNIALPSTALTPTLSRDAGEGDNYPLHAITQRPMMMYHSWDSQNAWLRQIISQNYLYVNTTTATKLGLHDLDWIWVESLNGKIRCQMKTMAGVESNTVWTWNAIGKMSEAWGLEKDAAEATVGFLLNHLISESVSGSSGERLSNSDPITGQAAWYDLKVRIYKAEEKGIWPKLEFGRK